MLVIGRNNFNDETKKTVLDFINKDINERLGVISPTTAINITILGVKVLDVMKNDFSILCRDQVVSEFKKHGLDVTCISGYESLMSNPSLYVVMKKENDK